MVGKKTKQVTEDETTVFVPATSILAVGVVNFYVIRSSRCPNTGSARDSRSFPYFPRGPCKSPFYDIFFFAQIHALLQSKGGYCLKDPFNMSQHQNSLP